MSIVVPSAHSFGGYLDLFGDFTIDDDEPLDTFLKNCNGFYALHSPPLMCSMPLGALATSHTWYTVAPPSVDGIDYTFEVITERASTGGTVTLSVDQCDTNTLGGGGGWVNLFSQAHTHSTATIEPWSHNATVSSSDQWWRIQLSAAVNCRLRAICVYPRAITALSATEQTSGFIAYDDAMLIATGGTVHRELFNRGIRNIHATLRDRVQRVVDYWGSSANDFKRRAATDLWSVKTILKCGVELKGQAGATLNLRVRAYDEDSGQLEFGEMGGEMVRWTVDTDVDRTGTLTIRSDRPILFANAVPGGTGPFTVSYIAADWTPGD